jgi:hypothetical protein
LGKPSPVTSIDFSHAGRAERQVAVVMAQEEGAQQAPSAINPGGLHAHALASEKEKGVERRVYGVAVELVHPRGVYAGHLDPGESHEAVDSDGAGADRLSLRALRSECGRHAPAGALLTSHKAAGPRATRIT